MKRFSQLRGMMLLGLLLAVVAPNAFAQLPEVQGIGLSGSPGVRDSIVFNGDSLYVIASYIAGPEYPIAGVGLERDSLQMIRVYLHPDTIPGREPIGVLYGLVDPQRMVFDTISVPHTVEFATLLPEVTDPYVRSLQVELAVYWSDTSGHPFLSELRDSQFGVDGVPAVRNSVDALHTTYLRFRDNVTLPPHILSLDSGMTIGRRFNFVYNQPEPADSALGALSLVISRMEPFQEAHFLYIHNDSAGAAKTLPLDAYHLFDRTTLDTLLGGDSLSSGATYQFVLSYRDINHNPIARATVSYIHTDLRTETPSLYEPRIGYQPADPYDSTVYVVYSLPEGADSLWLTFEPDTNLSAVADTIHILRMAPGYYGPGLVNFHLEGQNIGTNNPMVVESNIGLNDRLVPQCIYKVTLTYGDSLNNDNVSVTNDGYVWPRDQTTIPPRMVYPAPPPPSPAPPVNYATNATMRLEYYLPETPWPGSVYMILQANAGGDPGSPHNVYLHTEAPGHMALTLNATGLSFSSLVDSVTGGGTADQNNTLVDSLRYRVRVAYRDSLGNPVAVSPLAFTTFDNHTQPAQIHSPVDGDTLYQISMPVRFFQPEESFPGSLRLVLTQTGGTLDPGSPHTLYLSNDSLGEKMIVLQPASLDATPGVERVEGGLSLVERGLYRLSVLYSDTLNNPAARVDVNQLIYPSGTAVFASGGSLGAGSVIPNMMRHVVFRLDLKSLGGSSVLRRLRFSVQGSILPSDAAANEIRLFSSVDTVFSEGEDVSLDSLGTWNGEDMVFEGFTVPISTSPTSFFVSLYHGPNANPGHTVFLSITESSYIDCGSDPVLADHWPIGTRDVPLAVNLTSFSTAQDTLFGALRIQWGVASETANAGFLLLRRAENEDSFAVVANWRNHPELEGRGTEATASVYRYVDRGLTPGRHYTYRLSAESINFDRVNLTQETDGVPRIPPTRFEIGDAFPNPFNQDANFTYIVPATADVRIIIYDLLGRQVRTLVKGHLAPAEYHATWDSRNDTGVLMPSGVYWYRMKAGTNYTKAKKLLLIR
ncbi:MAG TPA: T9SS type A sorting domain-containing protein [bacterium]|jgi:hypothetical protein